MPPVAPTAPVDPRRAILGGFRRVLEDRLAASGAVVKRAASEDADLGPGLTLERMLDDRGLVKTGLSRVQRAFVRALDGTPQDATAPSGVKFVPLNADELTRHFGQPSIAAIRPTVAIPMTGVRAGKTLLSALALVHSVLTCSLRHKPTEQELTDGVLPDDDGQVGVRPGELVRAVIVTPKLVAGRQAFAYIAGAFKNSPRLAKCIVHQTLEKLIVKRPCDGHNVLIELVAMSAGGTNLRSTWLAGVIFDEAAFADGSSGEDAGVVNLADNYGAAVTRMLPGALLLLPSSPWDDSGLYYKMWSEARKTFGEVDEDGYPSTILSFHASSREMNPALSPKLEADARRANPQEAAREYDAIPLSGKTNLLVPRHVMERIVNTVRPVDLPYVAGVDHHAAADLGFRRNSSALGIARVEDRIVNGRTRDVAVLVFSKELIPPQGQPLKPSEVVKDFGTVCQAYGVHVLEGDRHYADSAIERLAELRGPMVGFKEFDSGKAADLFTRFRDLAAEGLVELPNEPRLIGQLGKIMLLPGSKGQMQVVLPKQGRAHADLALAVVMALVRAADAVRFVAGYDPKWDDYKPRWDSDGL